MIARKPICFESVLALALAILALLLAIFGVYSPWGALRFPMAMKLHGLNAVLAYGGTCLFPIVLGMASCLIGARSYGTIDRSQGQLGGEGQAFFSLMTGFFAVIVGFCTTCATLIWPLL